MSNLQILTQSIRTFENLYALNDLHIASGGKSKHQPSNFVRLDTTKALIAEIEKDNQHALKIIRGTNGGTYACEELVIAYAMWISPQFHLVVLRALWQCTASNRNSLHCLNQKRNSPLNLPSMNFNSLPGYGLLSNVASVHSNTSKKPLTF